ncbi:hypothetical protein [Actinomyces vulturis]|uniref:hypothetical protein n=1 Tax=Actinomyces vulturis TaxID=1857645 RepID=UPI00083611FA|nr:hypothetical protein [Actinomyces vulturis]
MNVMQVIFGGLLPAIVSPLLTYWLSKKESKSLEEDYLKQILPGSLVNSPFLSIKGNYNHFSNIGNQTNVTNNYNTSIRFSKENQQTDDMFMILFLSFFLISGAAFVLASWYRLIFFVILGFAAGLLVTGGLFYYFNRSNRNIERLVPEIFLVAMVPVSLVFTSGTSGVRLPSLARAIDALRESCVEGVWGCFFISSLGVKVLFILTVIAAVLYLFSIFVYLDLLAKYHSIYIFEDKYGICVHSGNYEKRWRVCALFASFFSFLAFNPWIIDRLFF